MRIKNILFYVFCILCVIAGGIMPFVSPHIQDQYLSGYDYKNLDLELLSISDDYEMEELLITLAYDHNELDYNGKTNMTYEEVENCARKATSEFIDNHILPDFDVYDANIKMNVYMVSSETKDYSKQEKNELLGYTSDYNNEAFIIWNCIFSNIDGITYSIKLDDMSGKIVALNYSEKEMSDSQQAEKDDLKEIVTCSDFITEYYGLNGELVTYRDKNELSYYLLYSDVYDIYHFTLVIRDNYVSLNH